MRDLPEHQNDVVVAVVTKTLQSANINVNKIIDDAMNKEASLESEIQRLTTEIDALQTEIANKKEQINVTNAMLEETRKVRELLEKSDNDKQEKTARTSPKTGKARDNERDSMAVQETTNRLAADAN
jgi:chromosome segregation ATPase